MSFFRIIFVDEFTKKILDAQSFNNRTVQLNHRARYVENIDIHDIKIEVLVKTNDKNNQNQQFFSIKRADFDENNDYSIAEKMKFANHKNANTFFDFYMSQLSMVNGIKNY